MLPDATTGLVEQLRTRSATIVQTLPRSLEIEIIPGDSERLVDPRLMTNSNVRERERKRLEQNPHILRGHVLGYSAYADKFENFVFSWRNALARSLSVSAQLLENREDYAGLLTLRGFVEQCAKYLVTTSELAELALSETENEKLFLLNDLLHSRMYSTSINWELLARDTQTIEPGRVKSLHPSLLAHDQNHMYRKSDGLTDLTPGRIGRDFIKPFKLRCPTVNRTYDLLSEVAHPNNWPTISSVVEQSYEMDAFGVVHKRNRLVQFSDSGSTLSVVPYLVPDLEDFLKETSAELQVSLKHEQTVRTTVRSQIKIRLRNNIPALPDLFDNKEPCPCRSGKQIRRCCGKKRGA